MKVDRGEVKVIGCNAQGTSLDPPPMIGVDIIDPTKPLYLIIMSEEEQTETGYFIMLVSSEPFTDDGWKLFGEGSYLTEHQSLAAYPKKTELKQVAFTGDYQHLSNRPTIPVLPENIVTGSGTAYTVKVQSGEPAAGTADNIITIVIPE
jgi:hypothetical protein